MPDIEPGCTLQLNLYVPGLVGAVKVVFSPWPSSAVLRRAVSETTSCWAVSSFSTSIRAPGATVSGAPYLKSLILMVPP